MWASAIPLSVPLSVTRVGLDAALERKCLEIGAINLRGVVHSDSGLIAVTNIEQGYFPGGKTIRV